MKSISLSRRARFVIVGFFLLSIPIFFSRKDSARLIAEESPRHILGSSSARVHVVGYFDLEAAESRRAWQQVARLREQYGDRVAVEFRHYPVTALHRYAMTAALALESAGEQTKFWEFLDLLWDQQDTWRSVPDPNVLFAQYAEEVGITDTSRFQRDMEQQWLKQRILVDLDDANAHRVSFDAPFLVNGEVVSVDVIQLAAERILSKPE